MGGKKILDVSGNGSSSISHTHHKHGFYLLFNKFYMDISNSVIRIQSHSFSEIISLSFGARTRDVNSCLLLETIFYYFVDNNQ